jgi:putative restriction endonuclease
MTPDSIREAFARLEYRRDKRRPPDERRRGQFRAGWEDATKRGEVYAGGTLERLTWRNLGYRLGRHFGDQVEEQLDAAFDILAGLYEVQRSQGSAPQAAPSPEQYASAFRGLGSVSDTQIQMLRLHYNAPERTISATQMAHAAGYSHYSIANSQYGRLGRLVGDQLEYNPMKERLGTLVTFQKRQGEWHWIMRPQVAEALERLSWVEGTAILLPEEIAAATTPLVEGAVCRVTVNAYERNPQARRRCIEAHGTKCAICGFSFGETYGKVAEGYIHVHHLRPLSEIGGEYTVDPVEDLRPVCPNCHAVLHRRIPAFSIEEVQAFLGGRTVRAIAPNQTLQKTAGA